MPVPTPPKATHSKPIDVFHATTRGSSRDQCLDEARAQAKAWFGAAVTLRNVTSTANPNPSGPGYIFRCDSWWNAS